jgi:hypothetical protein
MKHRPPPDHVGPCHPKTPSHQSTPPPSCNHNVGGTRMLSNPGIAKSNTAARRQSAAYTLPTSKSQDVREFLQHVLPYSIRCAATPSFTFQHAKQGHCRRLQAQPREPYLRFTSHFSEYTISAATKWGFLGTWTSDPLPAVSTENAPERRMVVTASLQGGECQSPDQAAARRAMSRQGRLRWGRSCADVPTIPPAKLVAKD